MKTKYTIDALFEQARKQAAIPSETPLLSEQDIKRLLNTLPITQVQQNRERSALQGLRYAALEYFLAHWGRFAFASGIGAVLLWAGMEVMPNRPNTSEEIPIRQNMTQKAALKRETTMTTNASSAYQSKRSQAQSRITATKRSKVSTQFALKHNVVYSEPFVLSDNTPCYNAESTRMPEEKLMREMLNYTLMPGYDDGTLAM